MVTPPDLSGNIQTGAINPAAAAADGVSANQHPLPNVIEADRYLAAKQATQAPPFGVVFAKFVSPGTQT